MLLWPLRRCLADSLVLLARRPVPHVVAVDGLLPRRLLELDAVCCGPVVELLVCRPLLVVADFAPRVALVADVLHAPLGVDQAPGDS